MQETKIRSYFQKVEKTKMDEGKVSPSSDCFYLTREQLHIDNLEIDAENERRIQMNNSSVFYVCLPFLPLFSFLIIFNSSSSSNESWMNSFRLALSLCGTLIASHTCTVSYIAWRDLTGQWKKYSLIKNRKTSIGLYWRGYTKFLFDISLMLLPAMAIVSHFRYDCFTSGDVAWKGFLKQFIGYNIGELWVAGAHKLMHHPYIYATVHKRHHCAIKELVASAAWLDTTTEFLVAEIPALLMALMILPTNPFWHHLFFAYQGLGAASDHAGFSFDNEEGSGWVHFVHQNFFDGEYHYLHHLNPSVNYAGM
eukprot:g5159.t1